MATTKPPQSTAKPKATATTASAKSPITPDRAESPGVAAKTPTPQAKAVLKPSPARVGKPSKPVAAKRKKPAAPRAAVAAASAQPAAPKRALPKAVAATAKRKASTKTTSARGHAPLNALLEVWTIWQDSVGSAARIWTDYTAKSVTKSAGLSRDMLAAKNWQEIVTKQQAFATDAIDELLTQAAKIAAIGAKAASAAQKPLTPGKP
ncbi:MAG: phasin family protein [Rhodospirillaceae bacterium]